MQTREELVEAVDALAEAAAEVSPGATLVLIALGLGLREADADMPAEAFVRCVATGAVAAGERLIEISRRSDG